MSESACFWAVKQDGTGLYLGRLGWEEDVARAVRFETSEAARTGALYGLKTHRGWSVEQVDAES